MDLHNEFGVKPGPYHYLGTTIVVLDVITHDHLETKLAEPLVMYRPLVPPKEHVEGRKVEVHRRHVMPISEFKKLELNAI